MGDLRNLIAAPRSQALTEQPKRLPKVKRAHQVFRHARPWQFLDAAEAKKRKHRHVGRRMQRLTRVLAQFDHSGNCVNIWASANTILKRLREAEDRCEPGDRMKWSRATLFRYLKRLNRSGVASRRGLTNKRGSRIRSLDPEKLLSVPRECETQEVKDFEVHKSSKRSDSQESVRNSFRTAFTAFENIKGNSKRKTAAQPRPQPPTWTAEQLKEPAVAAELLNLLCSRYGAKMGRESWPMLALAWALRPTSKDPRCQRRIYHPENYVIRMVENLLCDYPNYQARAILERFDDLPGVYFDGTEWVKGQRPKGRFSAWITYVCKKSDVRQ